MIKMMKQLKMVFFSAVACFSLASCTDANESYKVWDVYGGSKENIKYSALTQIDTTNVTNLKPVWTYSTHDASPTNTSDMKTNAIIGDGTIYGLSPQLKIFSLDAATGLAKWVYDPVYVPAHGPNRGSGNFSSSPPTSRVLP